MNDLTLQHTHWQLPPTGIAHTQGEDDIHQCIANILRTYKGSDVLRPNFGSDHLHYIDQPYDIAIPHMVREIHQALAQWENRIKVQRIDISGIAPNFHFHIYWLAVDDIDRQIYHTEI
ncbi:MAG: GPW/gp25 family protein [Acinetobacter sp.]|nr:GPW/gp25 family protein [Acinetobacter sp.]